jgi:hypothetical protein
MNPLAEKTVSLKMSEGWKGVAAAGLKRPPSSQMDTAIPGFVFAAFGRYRRRLYFFIGNIGQDLSHP